MTAGLVAFQQWPVFVNDLKTTKVVWTVLPIRDVSWFDNVGK